MGLLAAGHTLTELLHDLLLQLQVIAPIENTIWFKPLGWEALVILRGLA